MNYSVVSFGRYSLVMFAGFVAATSCTKPNPDYCDQNSDCKAKAAPFCDLTGEIGGTPNRCTSAPFDAPPAPCSPDDAPVCSNNALITCSDSGEVVTQECALGCNTEALRCNTMVPSNGLGQFLAMTADAPDVTLQSGAQINTDDGTVMDGDGTEILVPNELVEAPTDGVEVRVFIVGSLEVGDVRVDGTPAIAIVAADQVALTGGFDVSGIRYGLDRTGPGGISDEDNPCVGEDGRRSTTDYYFSGAGGGGYSGPGGDGGDVVDQSGAIVQNLVGAQGGEPFFNPDLQPLRGGCAGAYHTPPGGAVQIVSLQQIELSAGAYINANGTSAERPGGDDVFQGGSSGGGILLEAPIVRIGTMAGLVANGKAGYCYGGQKDELEITTAPDVGGGCSTGHLADGGSGGARDVEATDGRDARLDPSFDEASGGGGGGSSGYIRINTASGDADLAPDAVISPVPSIEKLEAQ